MTTAALIAGYLWMAVTASLVLFVLTVLAVAWWREAREDWRTFSTRYDQRASVTELFPASPSNVRVVPPGEAS